MSVAVATWRWPKSPQKAKAPGRKPGACVSALARLAGGRVGADVGGVPTPALRADAHDRAIAVLRGVAEEDAAGRLPASMQASPPLPL